MTIFKDSIVYPLAEAFYTNPTVKHDASACNIISTAFGPLFSPNKTGGSSPMRMNGSFLDVSLVKAP
jgi:hypothetical protein